MSDQPDIEGSAEQTSAARSRAIAVVLALVVVNLVIVALALVRSDPPSPTVPTAVAGQSKGTPSATTSSSTAGTTSVPTSTGKATTSKPATSTAPAPKAIAPARQVSPIVMVTSRVAYRFNVGSCAGGGARLQRTADRGKTWTTIATPLRTITRVVPRGGSNVFIIGAAANCALIEYTSTDNGQTWLGPIAADNSWTLDAKNPAAVVAGGATSTPCGKQAVVSLARVSSSTAQALCLDGQIVQSGDLGKTWRLVRAIPGALAITSQQQPIGVVAYAVRTSPTAQCKGLEVLQMDGAGIPSTISCVPLDTSKVTPGTVSIAMIGTQGWLSVGASTWTTDDRKTWTKRG